jgi:hypothetical protein
MGTKISFSQPSGSNYQINSIDIDAEISESGAVILSGNSICDINVSISPSIEGVALSFYSQTPYSDAWLKTPSSDKNGTISVSGEVVKIPFYASSELSSKDNSVKMRVFRSNKKLPILFEFTFLVKIS